AALVVAGSLAGVSWLARGPAAYPPAALPGAGRLEGGALYGDTPLASAHYSPLIEALRARTARFPGDAHAYSLLGEAYLQRAREAGNPADYGRAEAALLAAIERQPGH